MKIQTLLVHAGLFGCFRNLPNSDMDYRIFNVHIVCDLLYAYTHGGPWFIVLSKKTFAEFVQNLTPEKSQGGRNA